MSSGKFPQQRGDLIECEVALAKQMGFHGPFLPIGPAMSSKWQLRPGQHVVHCGHQGGVELLWSQRDASNNQSNNQTFKRWISRLARFAPNRRFLHFDTCPIRGLSLGLAAVHRRGSPARVRSLTFELQRELAAIVVAKSASAPQPAATTGLFWQRLTDLVCREAVSARFFREFRSHLTTLERAWSGLEDDDRPEVRRDLTLGLLCRLLFVVFVSRAHGLSGQRNYLRWLLENGPQRHGQSQERPSVSVYAGLLEPLFFEALNTPLSERRESNFLGDLPFLNGGLFQPSAIERRRCVDLPNEPLIAAQVALFERFDFVTTESARARDERARIDPEMLGQVFETLMLSDERRRSGSFYTPAPLVRDLVADALVDFASAVSTSAGGWVSSVLSGHGPAPLSADMARELKQRLDACCVLDPAVGSGAFLLGAADALVRCQVALDRLLGADCRTRYQIRRQVITDNLYGVDVKAGAVRLCELRLWLSLIAEPGVPQPLEPLPNLDHRIRQGNSLLDPGLVVPSPRRLDSNALEGAVLDLFADLHGHAKQRAWQRLREAETNRLRNALKTAERKLSGQLAGTTKAQSQGNLFGADTRDDGLNPRSRADLEAGLSHVHEGLRSLDRGEVPFFSFSAAFPAPMSRGGFDVIVGNPPWVRAHDIDPGQRLFFKWRYAVCRGGGSGFERQVDLAAVFTERAMELLRPGGTAGLLLPSKLFRTRYGRVMRRRLIEQHTVRHFADYSLCKRRSFSAANYPAWLLFRRGQSESSTDSTRLSLSTPSGEPLQSSVQQQRLGAPDGPDGPWSCLPDSTLDTFEYMRASGVTLGSYGLRARLGLKTGLNRAFLTDDWRRTPKGDCQLRFSGSGVLHVPLAHAPRALRGRDIATGRLSPASRLLLPYDPVSGAALRQVSAPLSAHFDRQRAALLRRKDSTAGPLWEVFRTAALRPGPKVVWRDIATRLEAVVIGHEYDDDPMIPMNTTYFFATKDVSEAWILAGLLNSSWTRLFASVAAEPAMSGYRRYLGWTVERIPWPKGLRPGTAVSEKLCRLAERAQTEGCTVATAQIDGLVAGCYGLDAAQRAELLALAPLFPDCVMGD